MWTVKFHHINTELYLIRYTIKSCICKLGNQASTTGCCWWQVYQLAGVLNWIVRFTVPLLVQGCQVYLTATGSWLFMTLTYSKISVFWCVTTLSFVVGNHHFGQAWSLLPLAWTRKPQVFEKFRTCLPKYRASHTIKLEYHCNHKNMKYHFQLNP